jgi:hypothetical protein
MRTIAKYQPKPDIDTFLLSMMLMYAKAPKKAEPEIDGSFFLGEIGETKSDRGVERWCPCAPATGLK